MNKICVAGTLCTGKTVMGERIASLLNWKKASFAGAVKKIYKDYFNVNDKFIEEWKRNPDVPPGFQMPVRQSLQFIGDGMREIKFSVWQDLVLNKDNIVIDDGRYFSELKAVKEKGGINILVCRESIINNDNNRSEQELRPLVKAFLDSGKEGHVEIDTHPMCRCVDLFINNSGTLEQLYEKIDTVAMKYLVDLGHIKPYQI